MNGEVEVLEASSESGQRHVLEGEARTRFEAGCVDLTENRVNEAIENLREAYSLAPQSASIRPFLGLALARGAGPFSEARELCEGAAKQEFFNPELYLNLAKVFLRFDRRSEALRYLRRGAMIDPGHEPIHQMIASLGNRKLPIVPFLPRRHPVNRALGTARSRVIGVFARA